MDTAMDTPAPRTRRFLAPGVGAIFVFSVATALSVFAALTSDTPEYTRAGLSVWPALILGTWAVAIAINRWPGYQTPVWRTTWVLGFIGYLVHLWFSMGPIFGWSISAVYNAQGFVTATANFALLVLWGISALAAVLTTRLGLLHKPAMLLFVAATVVSTITFARGPSLIGGIFLVAWLVAALLTRQVPNKKT